MLIFPTLEGAEQKYENKFAYKMVLKSPERRKLELLPQYSDPAEELFQKFSMHEENEFGEKIYVYENTVIGQKTTRIWITKDASADPKGPGIKSFPKLSITWTIIQRPSEN